VSFHLLLSHGMQLPLAVISFLAALAIVVGVVVAPDRIDPPVGLGIAVLLLLNGAARLLLWVNRSRLP
jgi:hypothetical protein